MMTDPWQAQPSHVQAIVADMMAGAAAHGVADEWVMHGPAIVQETGLKDECAAAMAGGSFVTLRCDVATGSAVFVRAPAQGEHRIVLDASSSNQLEAYRGLCRLFYEREQQMLGMASEILIVAKPSAAPWIAHNLPHPTASTQLRLIIILPAEDPDWDHFDDMHQAAHLAVTMARQSAKLATVVWLLHDGYTRISAPDPQGNGKVVMSAAGKSSPPGMLFVIGDKAHKSETTDMFLDWSHRIEVHNSRPLANGRPRGPIAIKGGFETSILSSGCDAAYWLGYLSGGSKHFSVLGFSSGLPSSFSRRSCLRFVPDKEKPLQQAAFDTTTTSPRISLTRAKCASHFTALAPQGKAPTYTRNTPVSTLPETDPASRGSDGFDEHDQPLDAASQTSTDD